MLCLVYIYMYAGMCTQIYCFQQMGAFAVTVTVTFDDDAQLSTNANQRNPGNQIVIRDDCLWSSRYFSEFYDNHHNNLMDSGLKRAVSKTLALASGVIDLPT